MPMPPWVCAVSMIGDETVSCPSDQAITSPLRRDRACSLLPPEEHPHFRDHSAGALCTEVGAEQGLLQLAVSLGTSPELAHKHEASHGGVGTPRLPGQAAEAPR